jgi:tetratricopeptide (TPR) repeat protein
LLAAATAVVVATTLVTSFAIPSRESNDLLPILCWLVIGVIWLLHQWLHGKDRVTFGATSLAILIMLVLHTTSGLVKMWSGNPRATINSIWQWIGFGLMFWIIRQLVRSDRESRALCAVMIGVAGFSAIHGGYESFYSLPRDRATYWSSDEAGKQALHRYAGLEPLLAGTPGRFHFETRLQTNEPTGSFALTNSLAAFLTPWLVLAIGIFLGLAGRTPEIGKDGEDHIPERSKAASGGSGDQFEVILVIALAALLIGMCLIVTKSRSAYVATALAVTWLVWRGQAGRGSRFSRRSLAWILGAVLIMIGVAIGTNRVDATVVHESFKSFSYRIQYWQSALGIIMADPLLGCGSGNFQQYFSQFKLPETSETVADPHNFILEIWATAGTLTLLAVGWLAWTFCRESSTVGNPGQADGQQDRASNVMPVYLGAMVGGSVPVFLLTSHELFLVLPFLLVIFGINKLHPWVQAGSLSPWLLKVALAGWVINLLAVGGIGIPGVAVTGWLLLALALPRPVIREGALKRRTSGLLLVASLFLMVAFYITGLLPIYRAAGHLAAGDVAAGQAQQQWIQGMSEQAEQHWEKARISWLAATRSDPYSSLPWMELTRLSWQRWQHFRLMADYQQMQRAAEQAIRLNRRSYVVQAMIGDWHLVSYAGQYSERLDLALQAYRQAHRFYPNSAILTARLAWLYDLRGEPENAAREAQRSLELDNLNPHMEFKLSLRPVFEGSSLEGLAYLPLTNARQAMENLRSGSLEGKN